MPDTLQPIDLREGVRIQRRIALLRQAVGRLQTRAQGQQHDEAAEALDDALLYLADAWDAMERDLNSRSAA